MRAFVSNLLLVGFGIFLTRILPYTSDERLLEPVIVAPINYPDVQKFGSPGKILVRH